MNLPEIGVESVGEQHGRHDGQLLADQPLQGRGVGEEHVRIQHLEIKLSCRPSTGRGLIVFLQI